MSIKKTIARNVAWSWADTAAHMVGGFVVAPYLVQQLGKTHYGLWVLIASMTGYLDLLDLGLRGSLGRNIAYFRAKRDRDGVNAVASTGLALLCVGALAVLAVTFVARFFFFWLFPVEQEAVAHVDLALILIGINLALIFPLTVFESVLWAEQRFDLLHGIDIPTLTLRVVLTFLLVGSDSSSLVTLAIILIIVTLVDGTITAITAFRLNPDLRLDPRLVRWRIAGQLGDFGIWVFLCQVARNVSASLGPFLIGSQLSVALVASYNFAARLREYVRSLLVASTGVLTPLATAWHAEQKHDQQRWLFVEGGKLCTVVALFFFGGFAFLGDEFLLLWTRMHLESASTILIILYAGEMLPFTQAVTYNTVLGMNRHRLWASMSLLELGLVVTLTAAFLPFHPGVISIAWAIALPATVCRGLVQFIYACRLLRVPLWYYVWRALLTPALAAAPATVGLWLATEWYRPSSWEELLAYGAVYGLVYGISAIFLVFGYGFARDAVLLLYRRLRPGEEFAEPAPGLLGEVPMEVVPPLEDVPEEEPRMLPAR
jgi:O-antigen/teichoic acid export membrane protein